MSQNITLVQYQSSDDGRLYEPEEAIIESAFITPDLIDLLERNGLIEIDRLYEELGSDSSIEIRRVRNLSIDDLALEMERELLRLLDSDIVSRVKIIQTDDDINSLMIDFRSISSVHHIAKLKKSNFGHLKNTIIKIG